jgi:hypothetical protein
LFFVIHGYNLHNLEIKSDTFYQKKENYNKIQDFFHTILPHYTQFEYAPDILSGLLLAYIVIMQFKLIYHLSGYIFTLILFRQLVIQMTVLPKNEICNIKHSSVLRGGCYDKIFSAHFGITMLSTLILYENGLINKFFAIFINAINALFILLGRCHYTIDIVVSIMVVVIIYQNKLNICEYLEKYF